jgi:iron complex transport system ATP-binding protein
MIKVEGASFSYNPGKVLFRDLCFELGQCSTLAVLGANGAGKTTLLRCLMKFLKLSEGSVYIEGVNSKSINDAVFWRTVSYVPQAKNMVFGYSVLNMVMMGRSPYIGMGRLPKKEDIDAAMEILARLGLEPLADQSCNSLSGGELQMVLIARALVKNPSMLIMDEPESNLDMKNQLKVLDLIGSLGNERKLTIIINTHFPTHALRVADKVLLLGDDRYIYDDAGAVINKKNIVDFFGVHSAIVELESAGNCIHAVVPTGIAKANNKTKEYMYESIVS